MDLIEMRCEDGDWIHIVSGQGQMAGSCKHGKRQTRITNLRQYCATSVTF